MQSSMNTPSGELAMKFISATGVTAQYDTKELNKILKENSNHTSMQKRVLEFLRDNVNHKIPSWYYNFVLGHDVHLTVSANLRAMIKRVDTSTWEHPYKQGLWLPNNDYAPIVSTRKVTTAFRDDIADALTDAAGSGQLATFNDYKYHEVGTDATAESNAHTALQVSSGIARATGTQVNSAADEYQSVATITADAGETWQEHGLFNASSSGQMMDRSVFTGIAVTASDQVQFTYTITFNAEA